MPLSLAKRRKRPVVHDSEAEALEDQRAIDSAETVNVKKKSRLVQKTDVARKSISSRTRTTPKPVQVPSHPDTTQWSPPSSPERHQAEPLIAKKCFSKGSLHAFFKSINDAPIATKEAGHGKPLPAVDDTEEQEDMIEDDSLDEKAQKLPERPRKANSVLERRKPLQEQTQISAVTASQEKKITGSQKFLTLCKPSVKEASTQTNCVLKVPDTRPWSERYGPRSLDELAVHKRKVADVRGWLDRVLLGRERKRLLILRGPAGAGKTATVSALAKSMHLDLFEWRNPVVTDYTSEAYVSMSDQFEDFLGRSGRFGSLAFSDAGAITCQSPSKGPYDSGHDTQKQAILMEEFPNTFMGTSQALKSFRTNIMQYLANNTPSASPSFRQPVENGHAIRPLIMIITETTPDSATSLRESFTAHRLLGPEILHHPGTSMIDFNPIAPTLLTKALELVIQKEARDSGRRRIPGPAALQKLCEFGDVRSAVGSLEFLCLRADDTDDWGGRVAGKSKKRANSALTSMEKATLELVSQREASLGLFHAVGKVVYNKREEPPSDNRPTQPPDHLPLHARLKTSEIAINSLMEETGTEPQMFIAALHENFVRSCEGNDFTETFNGCIDALSESDILISRNGRNGRAGGTYQSTPTDGLRQDELSFQTAVRGLLFALPYPVKRSSHPVKGARNRDAHKMFYPTFMRLGQQMEEIESLIKRWSVYSKIKTPLDDSSEADATSVRSQSQAELILEKLPYITKIQACRPRTMCLSDLERITLFNGSFTPTEEALEDDDLTLDALNDKALMPPPVRLSRGAKASLNEPIPLNQEVQKLYISDDDIEDD